MDNLEKDLYMHDREETSQNRRRFPYRYYYVEHQSGLGSVVRWNREYIQVIDSTHFEWETDNRWHITDQELPKFAEENAVIYVLDSPIKIARGVDCARYCRLYEDPQGKRCYNYAHYEKTDKKQTVTEITRKSLIMKSLIMRRHTAATVMSMREGLLILPAVIR